MRYTHEDPDWPNFRWDANSLLAPLGAARDRRGQLIGRIESIGMTYADNQATENLVREVQKTSAIEGVKLDANDIRSSIARRLNLETAGLPKPSREADAIVAVMIDATKNYHRLLDEPRILKWHSMLFPQGKNELGTIRAGFWRDDAQGPMQVVSGAIGRETVYFEAPDANRLPDELRKFFRWCESTQQVDALLRSAIAHLWFVTLHPFDDGNGRIARAIGECFLARLDKSSRRYYSMSSEILDKRRQYYDILKRTQKGNLDITEWLVWFIACFDAALIASERRIASAKKRTELRSTEQYIQLNERQKRVLDRMLEGFEGVLTSSKYAKLAKTSQDSAIRDIKDLIEKGILKQEPGGGRSTSYSLRLEP